MEETKMRRSAAPSQLTSKRPRFNPPTTNKLSESSTTKERSVSEVLTLINAGKEEKNDNTSRVDDSLKLPVSKTNTVSTFKDGSKERRFDGSEVLQQVKDQIQKENGGSEVFSEENARLSSSVFPAVEKKRPKFKPFRTPSMKSENTVLKTVEKNTNSGQTSVSIGEDEGPKPVYYSVVWCKLSKKKHKKWEGDAILMTKGRSVTIMDLDGKEIGKGTGYKTSELQALGEGNTLVIGGKEIEIMGQLSEEDFKSGKCFNTSFTKNDTKESVVNLNKSQSKPFVKPGKTTSSNELSKMLMDLKPRHDPNVPGALVLPRPSSSHQWENNKSNSCILDVVVDPYLSQHLRPHQREGVTFLYQCVMGMKNYHGQGAILADEMGLGKTLQCICLIWTLLRQGPYAGKPITKKVIVVTPGSLVKNWLKEFKKWLGSERLKVYAVTQDNKVEDFVSLPQYPVCIISYEMLVRTIETIRQVKFDLIVCDEGHRLKNSNIKTTTFLNSLPCARRVVLTGTPVQNDLQELFSIVDFCNPGILGTQAAFRRVFEDPILASREPSASTETHSLGQERATELSRVTSMFILRRTSDINNKYLPPKVELVLFCQPSDLQLCLYRQLISSRVIRSCIASHDMGQHLMCISTLKKLCNHPALIYSNAVKAQTDPDQELYKELLQHYPEDFDSSYPGPEEGPGGKLSVLEEILAALYNTSPRERVVLVSNYTQTLDVLETLCSSKGYKCLRLDGQTPTDKRQQLVESFNNKYGQDFVFLLSCKAGGVGLNLIGASRLILYDIDWNPANDLQAMARVWRDGQRKPVYIYRLLTTGTIEEKMYQRQVSKQSLSGIVVDARSSNTKQCFSPDELKDLFTLQENTLCATHDLLGCINCGQQTSVSGSEITRTCQLQKYSNDKKNLCMDELLEWKHISGPDVNLTTVDPVLGNSSPEKLNSVTFAFWNESNKKTVQMLDTNC